MAYDEGFEVILPKKKLRLLSFVAYEKTDPSCETSSDNLELPDGSTPCFRTNSSLASGWYQAESAGTLSFGCFSATKIFSPRDVELGMVPAGRGTYTRGGRQSAPSDTLMSDQQ